MEVSAIRYESQIQINESILSSWEDCLDIPLNLSYC